MVKYSFLLIIKNHISDAVLFARPKQLWWNLCFFVILCNKQNFYNPDNLNVKY